MKSLVICMLMLSLPVLLFCQSAPKLLGASTSALANTDVMATDSWAIDGNPSGIANEPLSVGISVDNRFCESAMSVKGISTIIPWGITRIGLLYTHFGESTLSEQHMGLAFGRVFRKVQVGLSAHLYSRQSSEPAVPGSHAVAFSVGVLLPLNDAIHVGIATDNPIAMYWSGHNHELLRQRITIGIKWKMKSDWSSYLAVEKLTDWPLNIKIALDYSPIKSMSLKAGYSSEPSTLHLGTSLSWNQFSFIISSLYQTTTGISPQITLLWKSKK